jgi:hypothetical protein
MSPNQSFTFNGACDASAAVRLEGTSFFVTATDEDAILRVYDSQAPGLPTVSTDVSGFLGLAAGDEPDLEGAAQLGDLIFWITSHGRDKDGVEQKSRQRLFATSATVSRNAVVVRPTGSPYVNLLRDLIDAEALSGLGLREATTLAPEAPGGLNIEGLAPAGDRELLIGFRNPIPNGKAIVARLQNPLELLRGQAEKADLVLAGHLDLDGRGIRAIEFLPEAGLYVLIAGAPDDARNFRLFVWSGGPEAPTALDVPSLDQLNPEELIATSKGDGRFELHLFADDGDALIGDKKCKKVKDAAKRAFRMRTLAVQLSPTS